MRQVVAYNRLKTQWKIIYRQGPKSGGGCLQEVVVHLEALTVRLDWKNFRVLDWRLLMAWEVLAYERWSHVEVRLAEQLVHLKKEMQTYAVIVSAWEYSKRFHRLFEWHLTPHMTLSIETCIRRTPCIK